MDSCWTEQNICTKVNVDSDSDIFWFGLWWGRLSSIEIQRAGSLWKKLLAQTSVIPNPLRELEKSVYMGYLVYSAETKLNASLQLKEQWQDLKSPSWFLFFFKQGPQCCTSSQMSLLKLWSFLLWDTAYLESPLYGCTMKCTKW